MDAREQKWSLRERRRKVLVIRAQWGDTGAFAELIRGYQRMAWGYAYARLQDYHLAEDICQEAFTDAYIKLDRLKEPVAFPGWLRSILRTHIDHLTRRATIPIVPLLSDADTPATGYGRPEELAERAETIATLFVDAAGVGFTMEKLEPEQSVRYLNEYLEAVHQVILDHDGFMDKVVGDEIMAFWGAPLPSEEHAESACRTAVAVRKRLVELSEDFRRRGLDPVQAHIGVNTGEAIVGSFGPSDHPAYTPMGHAVNLGARLVSEARRNDVDIAVSEFTREALAKRSPNPDEEFALQALSPIETLIRKEPVKVYAVRA